MKLLVTATTFPRWKNDKVPRFIFDLCKQYRENGIDVFVLAPHYKGAKFVENLSGIKVYRFPYFYPFSLQKVCYEGGILDNLKNSLLAKIQVPFFLIADLAYMLWVIRKEKIEVIHSHWIISQGLIASLVSMFTKVQHINTMHAGDLALLEKIPFRTFFSKFMILNTRKFTVVSNHGIKRFTNILSKNDRKVVDEKVQVLPMGIDLSTFNIKMKKEKLKKKYNIEQKNVLLFIGRLSEKKGVKYLIKAMPNVLRKNPDTKLLILGDGREKLSLIKLVKDLNLIDNVEFKGFIDNLEKIHFLKLADILIIPSIETKIGDVEGLPVVLLEGLASRVSIIATDTGGISDIIKDKQNGIFTKQQDPNDLSKKVNELLSERSLSSRIKNNSVSSVQQYDWKVIGKSYSRILKTIINYG